MDWEKFGKGIWDAAMNAHKTGAATVEVPIQLPDGGVSRVTVTPPSYVQTRLIFENDEPRTQWRHGKKKSNGEIEWGEWGF